MLIAVPTTIVIERWQGIGSFMFAWVFNFMLMMVVLAINQAVMPRFTSRYFSSQKWEHNGSIYEWLGVNLFRKLLVWVGWEKLHKAENPVRKTTDALQHLEYCTRQSEFGHLVIFIIVSIMAASVAFDYGIDQAIWLIVLNFPLHLYPIILQRHNRPRYLRLLARI